MTEVLLRAELIDLLGGRHALDRAVAAGQWQRLLHGAYAASSAVPDLRLRAAAIARLLPEHAVGDRCLLWLVGVDVRWTCTEARQPPWPRCAQCCELPPDVRRSCTSCREDGRPRACSLGKNCMIGAVGAGGAGGKGRARERVESTSGPFWHTGPLRAPVPRTVTSDRRTRRLLRPRGTT